ncbi:DUF4394 domain-containing protein [bacterium]|nr:MAG: DUF4394 domain-containing protein [bacterium]
MSILSSLCRVALAGAALVAAKPALAIPAVGVTTGNSLITFDTDTPDTLTSGPTAVSGLTAGDSIVGIDLRPSNGVLYALTNNGGVGRLYTINRATAAATLVATLAADPADLTAPYTSLSGTEFGTDFNPVADRLRVVSDADQNLRINVATGLVTTDATLNYAVGDTNAGTNPNETAVAYSNSVPGADATTLYGLDFGTKSLVIQNPPNNGTLNTVGLTGINDAISISGFDIAPGSSQGFMTLTSAAYPNTSFLYGLNLATGTPESVDEIGVNARVRGLTLLPAFVPSVTNASTTEDTQTTSGLVITANTSNGSEVTHFKITEITNGTLYQNDGVTPISAGAFITVAQGNAGLKFTPALNFSGIGSFKVQASTSATDAGLGASTATATITVTAVNDSPVLTPATYNGVKGQSFSAQLVATDAESNPITYSTSDALPAGLTLSSSGLISGTPTVFTTAAGTVINVMVEDGQGGTDTEAITLVIKEAPSLIVTTTSDTGTEFDGLTSVREAINFANSNADSSTISFDPAVFVSGTPSLLFLTGDLPAVTTNITITGPTTENTFVLLTGVVDMNNIGNLTTNILKVTGGSLQISNINFAYADTAVNVVSGSATISNCFFGISSTGVSTSAPTTITNSTFAQMLSYGVYNAAGTTTIDSCTIASNAVGISTLGTVVLRNSLVAGNSTNLNTTGTLTDGGHNITTGTITDVGLDPIGPNANGGSTLTYAITSTSIARNAGATDLGTDQRGIARPVGSADDIGAFEFVPVAPSIDLIIPQNAGDKVGSKRTFTMSVSDGNGATDIKEMWLLINTRLNWSEGATLIYVPSASSPTKGLLYLRQGDAFLPPMAVGLDSPSAVLDNGAVRVAAADVVITVSQDGKSIILDMPLTIRDGLVGQNTLFARVTDKDGATDPAALVGDMGYVRFGPYTVTPQFSDGQNFAPTLSKLTPTINNSILTAGITPAQSFGFFVKDENGIGDMESVIFLAGKQRGWTNTATFFYEVRTRRLYLRSDNGQSWLGGGRVGAAGIIENSQVRVDLSKVKVTVIDGKAFGLTLPLQGKAALAGKNNVWLRVQDKQGLTSPDGDAQGYVLKGTWNLATAKPKDAPSTPSNGSS